jgi:HEAT repeat protein
MRRFVFPFLLVACSARGDLWVDPPPGTPLDWREAPPADYDLGALPKQERPVGGQVKPEWEEAFTRPSFEEARTKGLAKRLRFPRPSRVRTVDIWTEWRVPGRTGGWDYLQGAKDAPAQAVREFILARYFARKEMSYFLPEAELARYFVELGWPSVEPSIGCLADKDLASTAERVLKAVTGMTGLDGLAEWETWFSRKEGPAPKEPGPEEARDLDSFLAAWVGSELAKGGWGLDEGFGRRLGLYPELAVPHALKALDSPDPGIRRSAAGWLGSRKESKVPEALRRLLDHEDPVTAFRAFRGLAEAGDPSIPDQVAKDLKSKDLLRRAGALHAAGFSGNRRLAEEVAKDLARPELESTALVALARMGLKREEDRFHALALKGGTGKEAFRRLVALAALARMGKEEGGRRLARVFRDVAGRDIALEVAGRQDMTWANPEEVPTFRIFLIELAGRCPQKDWQGLLRDLAQGKSPVNQGERSRMVDQGAVEDELKGIAIQNLCLQKEDPFLEELARLASSPAVPGFTRACALLRVQESDPDRGLKSARSCLASMAREVPSTLAQRIKDSPPATRAVLEEVLAWAEQMEEARDALAGKEKRKDRQQELSRKAGLLREALVAALGTAPADEDGRQGIQEWLVEINTRLSELARKGKASSAEAKALAEDYRRLMGLWALLGQPLVSEGAADGPLFEAALAVIHLAPAAGDSELALGIARRKGLPESLRIQALGLTANPGGGPLKGDLLKLASDATDASLLRQAALLAVGRQGDRAAAKDLAAFLADKDGWVAFAAYVSLRRLTGEDLFCDWVHADLEKRAKAAEIWKELLLP